MGFNTECAFSGEDREGYHGSVAPPIYGSSLFTAPSMQEFEAGFLPGSTERYIYTRGRNPTVCVLEEKLALLERTDGCKFFASGMAAIAAVVMECARAGDHVVAGLSLYNHTYKLLAEYLPRYEITTTFVDITDVDAIEAAMRPSTRLLYLESPANPTMQIVDVDAAVSLANAHGIATAMDNSLATPFNSRPAERGVDYVLHSATKYLSGHSDVVAGAVCASSDMIAALLSRQHADLGGIIGPFEAWLVLRGIRTLGIRMPVHNQVAESLAAWLEGQPGVKRVYYPTLDSHPQVELARRQMAGGSGLIGVVPDGGMDAARRFVDALRIFAIAVSWGGFESLALPMWNSAMREEHRRTIGLEEGFVRLSIGLEDEEDLQGDLAQALRMI